MGKHCKKKKTPKAYFSHPPALKRPIVYGVGGCSAVGLGWRLRRQPSLALRASRLRRQPLPAAGFGRFFLAVLSVFC
jgi:hypothetical protein